ncbi:c-type cytochrome [Aromatoleum diolicum]|uniref:C-type cytochrome n=1 Tax=Aromatoleum diolicum TaxID=75796 RepID=A0ABX1QDL3_9RHOO|nr:c-type cytochrome [Aromatoleum diolicum]NMG76383.1 c-type cytochrome [Aromatoleum diolicum]
MRVRVCMVVALMLAAVPVAEAAVDRPVEQLVRERCRKCHGLNGLSSEPEFPKLAGQDPDYLTRQMANFKTGVRKSARMKQRVADLSGGEMRALAEYFSEKSLVPERTADPALVEIGRRIYFSGQPTQGVTACTTCHGPAGRGAIYLPRLAGQHAEYLAAQLRAFRSHSRTSPNMVMHTVVENITDPEIEAVAQFLSVME